MCSWDKTLLQEKHKDQIGMIEDEQNLRKILAKTHKQKTPKNAIKPKKRSRKMYQKIKHLLIYNWGYSNEQQ